MLGVDISLAMGSSVPLHMRYAVVIMQGIGGGAALFSTASMSLRSKRMFQSTMHTPNPVSEHRSKVDCKLRIVKQAP